MPAYRIDLDAFHGILAERQMSLPELCRRTGFSWSFTKYLANGERNPGKSSAERLAAVLEVPMTRFITVVRTQRSRSPFQPGRAA